MAIPAPRQDSSEVGDAFPTLGVAHLRLPWQCLINSLKACAQPDVVVAQVHSLRLDCHPRIRRAYSSKCAMFSTVFQCHFPAGTEEGSPGCIERLPFSIVCIRVWCNLNASDTADSIRVGVAWLGPLFIETAVISDKCLPIPERA